MDANGWGGGGEWGGRDLYDAKSKYQFFEKPDIENKNEYKFSTKSKNKRNTPFL